MRRLIVAAGFVVTVGGAAVADSPKAMRIARAGEGGLVALSDGTVLAWNTKADIQVRASGGNWGPLQHLSASFLEAASPGSGAFYLLGETVDPVARFLTSKVFSVREDGTAVAVARLPDDISAIVNDGEATWIATTRGVFRVAPDGALQSAAPAKGGNLLVARRGGRPIRCAPADPSKAKYQPPACESDSPAWRAEGSWTQPPFACGGALVEPGEAELVSRSLTDGRPLARMPMSESSPLACDGESIVVGSDRLRGLDPRTLRPAWSIPVAGRPVTAVAATRNEIVYFTPHGPRSVRHP